MSSRWTEAEWPTTRWTGLRTSAGVFEPVEISRALPGTMPRVLIQLWLTTASTCGTCGE